jgi:putative FmdB family regulatory protein
MPLYEYECTKCHHIEEQIGMNTVKEIKCEECGEIAKRLISLPSFKMNGEHWSGGGTNPKWDNIKPGDSDFKD